MLIRGTLATRLTNKEFIEIDICRKLIIESFLIEYGKKASVRTYIF